VERVRARDHGAFEELYKYYTRPILSRLVRLVGDREIAEDLHQETFLRAWRYLPETNDSLKLQPKFQSWLYRIAANLAIDHIKREKKFELLPLPEDEQNMHSHIEYLSITGPEAYICEKECYKKAFASLSPRHQTCLLLYDQWGFSQREISLLLDINVKSVSAYISRGREQFRQAYWYLTNELSQIEKGVRTQ